MRAARAFVALALIAVHPGALEPAEIRPVVVRIGDDRFEVSAEGNMLTGLRRSAVPFVSVTDLVRDVARPAPLAASARLVRSVPPQVVDYVFCITDDGVLVVGQQVRARAASGAYTFTEGGIKRAYSALEGTVPWTWIVDIPLAREVSLTLQVRAMAPGWPVRAVTVAPSVPR